MHVCNVRGRGGRWGNTVDTHSPSGGRLGRGGGVRKTGVVTVAAVVVVCRWTRAAGGLRRWPGRPFPFFVGAKLFCLLFCFEGEGRGVPHAVRPLEGRITLPVILLVDLVAAVLGSMITAPGLLGSSAGWFMGNGD